MTGEFLPVDKAKGDEVSSGTVNQFGAFEKRKTIRNQRKFIPLLLWWELLS
jgi:cation transport ATPase